MPVLHYTVQTNAFEAMQEAKPSSAWQTINWQLATRIVKGLQARIVKAVQAGRWRKVRSLQRLLIHSTSAKVLAIRRVTENTGKRTAGIDGELWNTPQKKFLAIGELHQGGYKAAPVKRVYIRKSNGKKRPLGIPTMKDRAMQALHLLGLDPIAETLADYHSYGFRRYRSCADAITRCHRLLSRRSSPQWILEGDIKGCFDHISHDWLLQQIPMNKRILWQWLKSGFFEKRERFPSESGTPQGAIISPTLANRVLDGMQAAIDEALNIQRKSTHRTYKNPYKVHLVRYADDFIITASTKEILEQQVQPVVEYFLAQRGLELSKEKTRLTHINEGFDFLGKTIRKYRNKLLIQPSKKNIKTFLDKIKQTIQENRSAKTIHLLYKLNDMIRGWAMYHRMDNAKNSFAYVDNRIWQMMWKWAIRRHPNKGRIWIRRRYYTKQGNRNWVFSASDNKQHLIHLFRASSLAIQYHIPIRSGANPYDPKDELYFEQRNDLIMSRKMQGRRLINHLYKRQNGICPRCELKITSQTGWHCHHIVPKYLGGNGTYENLVLLHPVCHKQVHAST